MGDERREIEMRVEGVDRPEDAGALLEAIRAIDPEANVRVDPATGIVHAATRRHTLEVVEALSRAGFDARAMTL